MVDVSPRNSKSFAVRLPAANTSGPLPALPPMRSSVLPTAVKLSSIASGETLIDPATSARFGSFSSSVKLIPVSVPGPAFCTVTV